jgi:hypothetical protein
MHEENLNESGARLQGVGLDEVGLETFVALGISGDSLRLDRQAERARHLLAPVPVFGAATGERGAVEDVLSRFDFPGDRLDGPIRAALRV